MTTEDWPLDLVCEGHSQNTLTPNYLCYSASSSHALLNIVPKALTHTIIYTHTHMHKAREKLIELLTTGNNAT